MFLSSIPDLVNMREPSNSHDAWTFRKLPVLDWKSGDSLRQVERMFVALEGSVKFDWIGIFKMASFG